MPTTTDLIEMRRKRKAEHADTLRQLEPHRCDQQVKTGDGLSIVITDHVIEHLERTERSQRAHIAELEACLRSRGVSLTDD